MSAASSNLASLATVQAMSAVATPGLEAGGGDGRVDQAVPASVSQAQQGRVLKATADDSGERQQPGAVSAPAATHRWEAPVSRAVWDEERSRRLAHSEPSRLARWDWLFTGQRYWTLGGMAVGLLVAFLAAAAMLLVLTSWAATPRCPEGTGWFAPERICVPVGALHKAGE